MDVSGISPSFPGLFRTEGYVPTCYSPVCRSRIATSARLACVKPAASVRSEPGSNSQVGENLFRLITTVGEAPPCPCAQPPPGDANRARLYVARGRRFITGH